MNEYQTKRVEKRLRNGSYALGLLTLLAWVLSHCLGVLWSSEGALRWSLGIFGAAFFGDVLLDLLVFGSMRVFPGLTDQHAKVPSWLSGRVTGVLERPFFCACVAANLGGCVIAMVAWSTIKNTAFWSKFTLEAHGGGDGEGPRASGDQREKADAERDLLRNYVALLHGLASMGVALIFGLWIGGAGE